MAAKNRHNAIDCLAAALPDEEYWVLLARDPAMPGMLAIWASIRIGNVAAAWENFRLLMSDGLPQHYKAHPDEAKSIETIATAQRAHEWRMANLTAGPNGTPRWKSSLVRPCLIELKQSGGQIAEVMLGAAQEICPTCQEFTCECEQGLDLDTPEGVMAKVALGLRQLAAESVAIDAGTHSDRIRGYAAELEAAAGPSAAYAILTAMEHERRQAEISQGRLALECDAEELGRGLEPGAAEGDECDPCEDGEHCCCGAATCCDCGKPMPAAPVHPYGTVSCDACGVDTPVTFENEKNGPKDCPHCGAPLWEEDEA